MLPETPHTLLKRLAILTLVLLLIVLAVVTVVNFASSTTDENVFVTSPSRLYVHRTIAATWERVVVMDRLSLGTQDLGDSLRTGDLVFGLAGKRVMDRPPLTALLQQVRPDSVVEVYVYRPEKRVTAAFNVRVDQITGDAVGETDKSVVVTEVTRGGASDRAGMHIGDLIFKINGKGFTSDLEADQILRMAQSGKTITYDIYRDGRELTLNITLARFGLQIWAILVVFAGLVNFSFGTFLALKRPNIAAALLLGISYILLGFFFMVWFNRRDVASLFISFRDAVIYIAYFFGFAANVHATVYFPLEKPEMSGRRWVPVSLYALAAVLSVLTALPLGGNLLPGSIATLVYAIFLSVFFRKAASAEYKRLNRPVRYGTFGFVGIVILVFVLAVTVKGLIDIRMIGVPVIIFPLLYLYVIGRHRLLDLNLRIRRNLQYTIVSMLWGILAAVIFMGLLSLVLSVDLHIPVVLFTGTSVEVTDAPASPEDRDAVRRALAVALGILAWYIVWRFRKRIQALIDEKYYRTHYDYRSASEQLVDAMATHLGMVELARGIVNKLASLMQVKRVAVLFFRDEKSCCCQEVAGVDASEWKEFCAETGDALAEALRAFHGEVQVDYLPEHLKAVFRKYAFQYLVPIRSKEKLIGTFVLGEKLSESTYSHEDLAFLAAAAKQASVAIENAFLYEELAEQERMRHELEIARRIQLASLPQSTPAFPGLDIAGQSKPAQEVGGDFFDYLNGRPGNLTVIVGDVSGKGTSAALYMSKVQGILRSLHGFDLSPGPLFVRANRLLCADLEKKSFITAVGAAFQQGGRRLVLARAGHLPIYRYDATARRVEAMIPRGLGLGLNNAGLFGDELEERTVAFGIGDVLLFVTDGVTEARNSAGEEYGETRLLRELAENATRTAGEIRNRLFDDLGSFCASQPQHDDQTIVVVKGIDATPIP